MSATGSRKLRAGDLNSGTGIFQINLTGTTTDFSITAAQLNLNVIEALLSVDVAASSSATQALTDLVGVTGNSLALGGTLIGAAGVTVSLQVFALGY
jgi:hypothetical protein